VTEGSAPIGDRGRFDAAIAAIDAANSDDPETIVVAGVVRPKELAHAEMMTAWVQRLDPAASEAQLLAARAHHLRRWTIARSAYPDGRAGYLRWRADLKRQHAAEVAAILAGVGYDDDTIARVGTIIRKEGIGRSGPPDPAVQTHEDALCLVFLETQFAELAARLGDERTVEIVRKTLAKMSSDAIARAGSLPLSDDELALIARAAAA
jgi:hypothetical protein